MCIVEIDEVGFIVAISATGRYPQHIRLWISTIVERSIVSETGQELSLSDMSATTAKHFLPCRRGLQVAARNDMKKKLLLLVSILCSVASLRAQSKDAVVKKDSVSVHTVERGSMAIFSSGRRYPDFIEAAMCAQKALWRLRLTNQLSNGIWEIPPLEVLPLRLVIEACPSTACTSATTR